MIFEEWRGILYHDKIVHIMFPSFEGKNNRFKIYEKESQRSIKM